MIGAQRRGGRRGVAAGTGGGTPNKPELIHAEARRRGAGQHPRQPSSSLRASAPPRAPNFIETHDRATTSAKPNVPLRVLRASARIHLFCTPAEAGAQLADAKDEAHHVITTTFPTGPRPSPEYQGAMQ